MRSDFLVSVASESVRSHCVASDLPNLEAMFHIRRNYARLLHFHKESVLFLDKSTHFPLVSNYNHFWTIFKNIGLSKRAESCAML